VDEPVRHWSRHLNAVVDVNVRQFSCVCRYLALRSRGPEPVLQIANRSIPVSNAEYATGTRLSEAVSGSGVNHCTPLPVAGGTIALPIQIPATDAHFIDDACADHPAGARGDSSTRDRSQWHQKQKVSDNRRSE
jgi:hypothetical protein